MAKMVTEDAVKDICLKAVVEMQRLKKKEIC